MSDEYEYSTHSFLGYFAKSIYCVFYPIFELFTYPTNWMEKLRNIVHHGSYIFHGGCPLFLGVYKRMNMSDLPNVAILLLTYKRTEMAVRTVKSTIENLGYPKEKLAFYVADDGSPKKHFQEILEVIRDSEVVLIGNHNERIRNNGQHDTHFAGLGWNKGLGLCHQFSDFVLVLEDDWELDEPLNLVPYIKLLQEREEVGAATFRILSTGADVHTVGHNGEIFLRYDRTTQYAYSGNPYIRHARYTKKYGWFAEDRNPGLIELHQDDQYRLTTEGPEIWRPVGISQWGAWKHIGSEKTWE